MSFSLHLCKFENKFTHNEVPMQLQIFAKLCDFVFLKFVQISWTIHRVDFQILFKRWGTHYIWMLLKYVKYFWVMIMGLSGQSVTSKYEPKFLQLRPISRENDQKHRTSVVRATESSFKRSPVFASKCCLHSYILVHQIW